MSGRVRTCGRVFSPTSVAPFDETRSKRRQVNESVFPVLHIKGHEAEANAGKGFQAHGSNV